MRHSVLAAVALIAVAAWGVGTARAGKVEVKGAHNCCGKCAAAITGILKKVDGVSDAVAEPGKEITFTAKDDKATTAALTALAEGGFAGTATDDGKDVKFDLPAAKAGDKADAVTVSDTHICCMKCQKALTALFPDDKVTFVDKSTMKIAGKDLDKAAVLEALRKGGFNGKVE